MNFTVLDENAAVRANRGSFEVEEGWKLLVRYPLHDSGGYSKEEF